MSKELADKLGELDISTVDITDSGAIAKMMGYAQDGNDTTEHVIPLQGDTTTAEPAPAAPAPVDNSATPAAVATPATEIAGVLTKDGKHVIPVSVLTEARTNASMQRMRADELAEKNRLLQQQLDDLKAGKPAESDGLTEELVAQMEEDFPSQGRLLRQAFERNKALETQVQPPSPRDIQQEAEDEASTAALLDAAIAARSLLTQYRDKGGIVWERAIEIDKELMALAPEKGLEERFVEVEKRLAQELGIPIPSTQNPPAATAAAPAPAKPAQAPQPTQIMPTLTDFGGGGVAVGDPMAGLAPGQMVDRAMSMDVEALRRMVGLSY